MQSGHTRSQGLQLHFVWSLYLHAKTIKLFAENNTLSAIPTLLIEYHQFIFLNLQMLEKCTKKTDSRNIKHISKQNKNENKVASNSHVFYIISDKNKSL